MRHKLGKDIAASLGLLVISLVLSFGIGEIVIRRFARQPIYPGRRLFLSDAQFDLTVNGAVRYLPADTIRMVAVYEGEVEFDVTFVTNNYGLVDDEDYPLPRADADKAYAVVGNSFAAGVHGDQPWVPRLRIMASQAGNPSAIYNLGVEGTGLWHFSRLLEDTQDKLDFDVIVIVAISDDFRRSYWTPVVHDSAVYLCVSEESTDRCIGRAPYASLFDRSIGQDSILQRAKQNMGTALLLKNPGRFLALQAKRSQFIVLLVRELKTALGIRNTFDFAGFRDLVDRQKGRDVYLLHVPQSNEVANGRYDVDVATVASQLGVTYVPLLEVCEWDRGMFYERDSHPNERGYQGLGLCVGKVLGLLP